MIPLPDSQPGHDEDLSCEPRFSSLCDELRESLLRTVLWVFCSGTEKTGRRRRLTDITGPNLGSRSLHVVEDCKAVEGEIFHRGVPDAGGTRLEIIQEFAGGNFLADPPAADEPNMLAPGLAFLK